MNEQLKDCIDIILTGVVTIFVIIFGVMIYSVYSALYHISIFFLSVVSLFAISYASLHLYGYWSRIENEKLRTWTECQSMLADADFSIVPEAHQAVLRNRRGQPDDFVLLPAYSSKRARNVIPEQPAEDPMTPVQPLLPYLKQLDRVLLIGGMGAGKTSLMKHLVAERVTQGQTYVIDSHAAPDTWPNGAEVIGRGRNYAEIETHIKQLHAEMDNRYKLLSSGEVAESEFGRLNIIIDEFTVLNKYCEVKDEITSLLCECRKVGFTLCIGGQSDRVKSLGLEGAGDLIHGFEAVCYLEKAADGERYGVVKAGRSKEAVTYKHPGIFKGQKQITAGPADKKPPTKKELHKLAATNYPAYLKTDWWLRQVRPAAFKKYGRKCSVCERTDTLQVHHLSYKHTGDELKHLQDLQILCRKHHAKTHGK